MFNNVKVESSSCLNYYTEKIKFRHYYQKRFMVDASLFVPDAYLYAWLFTFGLHMVSFIVAFVLQTEVFFDFIGALNYLILVGYATYAGGFHSPEEDSRKLVMLVLPCAARLWLISFLTYRAYIRGGDGRFDEHL